LGRTVGELLDSISSQEISEWQAFEAENGPVQMRPDWTAALITATLANIHRDRKSHPEAYEPQEFMLGGVEQVEQTVEQMAAIAEMTAAAQAAFEERQALTS
jgi:hypothetical protein